MARRTLVCDIVLITASTVAAGFLRLWQLGIIPQGVHGDEAQFAMDGQRVLAQGWIGPYTLSALGQPSGIAYVIAPGQWLFGSTGLGARFGVAVFAIAAVPLCYILFRLISSRTLAAISSFLLAVSLWHVHFSRVAYQSALMTTMELAVLASWALALRRPRWYWFALSGAMLGLGLYTYTVYPIFVLAFGIWVLLYTAQHLRDLKILDWVRNVGISTAVATLAGLALFLYILSPANHYFERYQSYYQQHSVLASPAFSGGDLGTKIGIAGDQVKRFVGAYVWHGVTDQVDAASPDGRPMLDRLTLALILIGLGYTIWHWRQTPGLLCLTMIGIIPLASILQTNSTYRGPLGVVPFLSFLAAVPLALAWEQGRSLKAPFRPAICGAAGIILVFVAYTNVHTYFGDWARSNVFRWVYAQEISEAAQYAGSLPQGPYVYFYSGRWSFNFETRRYLAPKLLGEDRSKEFGRRQGHDISRERDSLFLLLAPYTMDLPQLQALYPDGTTYVGAEGDRTLFVAYLIPSSLSPGAINKLNSVRLPPGSGR